jgi:hypothetical protein
MSPEEMEDQIKKLTAKVESLSSELADAKEKISLAPTDGALKAQIEVEDDNDKLKSKTLKRGPSGSPKCELLI